MDYKKNITLTIFLYNRKYSIQIWDKNNNNIVL